MSKTKTSKILKILLSIFIALILSAAFFVLGFWGGIKAGQGGIQISDSDLAEPIKNALMSFSTVDFNLHYSEDELNQILAMYQEKFSPLRNVKISLNDGSLQFKGIADTDKILANSENVLSGLLSFFLPDSLFVRADVQLACSEGELNVTIRRISVLFEEDGEEIFGFSDFSDMIGKDLQKKIEDSLPQGLAIKDLAVDSEQVRISGTMQIIY